MKKQKKQQHPAITQFPSPILHKDSSLSEEEKIDAIAQKFREIMEILGLDLSDASLKKTPYRVAKMYVKEIFSGLDPEQFPHVNFVDNKFDADSTSNFVFVKASFTSFCEHHFVPMHGIAYVAYLPNKKLLGLSKIPRIVRFFARRPQLQERLTAQIADSLALLLETEHVAVSITATHYCVQARGIEDDASHMITTVLRGSFKTHESLEKEFFEAINRRS